MQSPCTCTCTFARENATGKAPPDLLVSNFTPTPMVRRALAAEHCAPQRVPSDVRPSWLRRRALWSPYERAVRGGGGVQPPVRRAGGDKGSRQGQHECRAGKCRAVGFVCNMSVVQESAGCRAVEGGSTRGWGCMHDDDVFTAPRPWVSISNCNPVVCGRKVCPPLTHGEVYK